MLYQVLYRILDLQDTFTYEELREISEEFLETLPKKMKDDTKMKRLEKYLKKELELEEQKETTSNHTVEKKYSLDTIPQYLFTKKSDAPPNLIYIKNLTKSMGTTLLFQDIELKVNKTDKLALIGKNGTGKTTLLKMIIGKEEITDGVIDIAPGVKIGYLSQDLFWKSEKNTLREEIFSVFSDITKWVHRLEEIKDDPNAWEERDDLSKKIRHEDGFKKYELQGNILKYFWFTDKQMNLNVLRLSGGEQTKVQIAKFLIQEVDILILDEPTNHLDIEGIVFLEHFCKNWKKAIVSISHDVRFINNTSNKIIEISDKKIHSYTGNYELYLEEKQARFEKKMKDYMVQKKELDRQNEYINRFRANSAKASSVQSRIKAIEKINILEKPENESMIKALRVNLDRRLPEIIIKLKDIFVGYTSTLITLPEYLEVHKSDKIGIIGKNGVGKTTLLKTILGEIDPLRWEGIINVNLIIGSYSQVLEDLDKEANILQELLKSGRNQQEIRTMLGCLLITGEKVKQSIQTLSGWERAKVALTKMLLMRPHVIIMDEPTNHLDIHSKEVIKNMLETFEGTTIVVSHDRDLLESISNKIWLIKDKRLVSYDEPEKGFREIF